MEQERQEYWRNVPAGVNAKYTDEQIARFKEDLQAAPLDDQQRVVIEFRFGLSGETETLKRVGRRLGISAAAAVVVQKKAWTLILEHLGLAERHFVGKYFYFIPLNAYELGLHAGSSRPRGRWLGKTVLTFNQWKEKLDVLLPIASPEEKKKARRIYEDYVPLIPGRITSNGHPAVKVWAQKRHEYWRSVPRGVDVQYTDIQRARFKADLQTAPLTEEQRAVIEFRFGVNGVHKSQKEIEKLIGIKAIAWMQKEVWKLILHHFGLGGCIEDGDYFYFAPLNTYELGLRDERSGNVNHRPKIRTFIAPKHIPQPEPLRLERLKWQHLWNR